MPPPVDRPEPVTGRAWPLVGRAGELEDVLASTDGTGILVAGPMGVGKSRLLSEAADALAARGHDVIRIAGVASSGDLPLAPLLPVLREDAAAADPGRRILAELYRRGSHAPVVLVVDDAHHLDEASASVVHQVAGTGLAPVVAAVRTPEQQPPSIESLWRDEVVRLLELVPLGREDTRWLVTTSLDGPVARDVLDRLWELTNGFPLYLRELLRGSLESGALTCDRSGTWRLGDRQPLPDRLVDIVRHRIGRLDDEQRRALELASIAPGASLAVVASLAPLDAIDELARRGIVEVQSDGRDPAIGVSHPFIREFVVTRLPPSELDELRRRLGAALAAEGAHPARAASLLLDAGLHPDEDLMMAAVDEARENVDAGLLERLASAATDATGSVRARVALAGALAKQHRWDEAAAEFERALEDAPVEDHTSIRIQWMMAVFDHSQGVDAAAFPDGFLVIEPGTDPAVEETAMRLRVFLEPDRMDEVIDDFARFAERDDVPPTCRASAEVALSGCLHWSGRHRGALERAAGVDVALVEPLDATRLELTRIWAIGWSGSVGESVELARRWAAEAAAGDDVDTRFMALAVEGATLVLAGRSAEAVDVFGAAVGLLPVCTDARTAPTVLCYLAMHALELPRLGRELQELALGACDAIPPSALRLTGALLAVAHSRDERLRGDGDGLAPLVEVVDRTTGRAPNLFEAHALIELVRRDRAELALEPLTRLAGVTDTDGVLAWWAQAARDVTAGDGDRLEQLAARAATAGAWGTGADLAVLANRAHAAAGRAAAAFRTARAHRRLRGRLGDAACQMAVRPVVALSDREHEICELVLEGRSNRGIADALFVSVRTVEGHLHRAYRKLGVDGRDHLLALEVGWAAG